MDTLWGKLRSCDLPVNYNDTHGPRLDPCVSLRQLALSGQLDFTVAITTIYRSVFAGLKRYFSIFTTFSAYRREHLASGRPVAAVYISLWLPCLATWGAALRLVGIAFRREEFLFLSTERKSSATVRTLEWLVLKSHWMTSSLLVFGMSLGHPTLG